MEELEDKKITAAICRVCLSYDFQRDEGKGVSLFEEYNDCVISEKINALANVGIKEGDGLPDIICPECLLELENAFKFKLKCERSNEVLLSAVNEDPTFEDNDDGLVNDVLKIKEEYLDHVDNEYEELVDNPTAELEPSRSSSLETEPSVAAPIKPSRAIDLKLICNECGGSFKSKCKMRVHWKKMHFTDTLKCEKCLRTFKSFAALKSHKKQNLMSCMVATKVRIEGVGKNRIFYCKECNYHTKYIENMRAHICIHSGERRFQCDLCLKYFTQLAAVLGHKESVHKLYRFEGTCDHCGKHVKGRSRLHHHIKTHYISSVKYPCKICPVVLKSKYNLTVHMKKHSGVRAYSCEICSASFYGSAGLWCHREKVHIKSRQYTCDVCNYKTRSGCQIKKHKSKHTATNFGCNVCGTMVENEYQLELHQKRHTDRNFPCPHCDKTYYSKSNLSAHVRGKHRFVMLTGPDTNNRPVPSKSLKSELSAKI